MNWKSLKNFPGCFFFQSEKNDKNLNNIYKVFFSILSLHFFIIIFNSIAFKKITATIFDCQSKGLPRIFYFFFRFCKICKLFNPFSKMFLRLDLFNFNKFFIIEKNPEKCKYTFFNHYYKIV